MKVINTKFKDLLIVSHKIINDSRGYFKESFKKNLLEEKLNYQINFCQENNVCSNQNVLRGLHFQKKPFEQSKFISVLNGEILDIAVDIRRDSDTYGKYFSYILSSSNHESLFIPKGFAHGYLTISDKALINYKVDNYYAPDSECGILYNDEYLNIDWKIEHSKLLVSKKDKNQVPYKWH